MKKSVCLLISLPLFALIFSSCAGSDSNPTSIDKLGGVMLEAFSGNVSTAAVQRKSFSTQVMNLFISQAQACAFLALHDSGGLPPTTCKSLSIQTQDLTRNPSVVPGTYGTKDNSITITADQGCDKTSGIDSYASFALSNRQFSCIDGKGNKETVTLKEASGIWRNNINNGTTEIFGTYRTQNGNETSDEIKCSLAIFDPNAALGGRLQGSCEDSNGNTVEQTSDVTCSPI